MPVQTRKRTAALVASSQTETGLASSSANTDSGAPAKRQKGLSVRSREEDAGKSPVQEKSEKPVANVVRFDDEGNADNELIVPAAAASAPAPEAEESEDDSDEAPEAVSTTRVAKEMMESAQVVRKLAQEQAAASKRKRQQRDALFKKQALERRETNPHEEMAPPAGQGRRRVEKTNLPEVLPAEFLADSSSEDEEHDVSRGEADATRHGKRTVQSVERRLARQGRGPRDEVIGTTVYRIMSDANARMAPKVKKHAQSSKNLLLRRGRQPVRGRNSGFFKS